MRLHSQTSTGTLGQKRECCTIELRRRSSRRRCCSSKRQHSCCTVARTFPGNCSMRCCCSCPRYWNEKSIYICVALFIKHLLLIYICICQLSTHDGSVVHNISEPVSYSSDILPIRGVGASDFDVVTLGESATDALDAFLVVGAVGLASKHNFLMSRSNP